MSILSFLRKYGETEDPLFQDLPVETPPPDLGDAGLKAADDASSIVVDEDEFFNG